MSMTSELVHRRIPFWRDDKSAICDQIRSRQGFLKILLKTKNERHFLRDWVDYHSSIVGYENLIVFDNMSTDEKVLREYGDLPKETIVVQYDGFHNFVHKVEIFPELYSALSNSCEYFSFIDTDEFVSVVDGYRHLSGTAIRDFVASYRGLDVLPAAWLINAPYSRRLFNCGTSSQQLEWGLAWGKPIIRSRAKIQGIVLHNIQLNPGLYRRETPKNVFALHMKELFPEQRIAANLAKLRARGFALPEDRPEDIILKDVSSVSDDVVFLYLSEIRNLLESRETVEAKMKEGFIEISEKGLVTYFSEAEERLVKGFLVLGEGCSVEEIFSLQRGRD